MRAISEPPTEVVTMFELDSIVAAAVRECARRDELPAYPVRQLLQRLSRGDRRGLIGGARRPLARWSPRFDTPETTREGSIDAMALAIATGHCWRGMARGIEGFAPVPASMSFTSARAPDHRRLRACAMPGPRCHRRVLADGPPPDAR